MGSRSLDNHSSRSNTSSNAALSLFGVFAATVLVIHAGLFFLDAQQEREQRKQEQRQRSEEQHEQLRQLASDRLDRLENFARGLAEHPVIRQAMYSRDLGPIQTRLGTWDALQSLDMLADIRIYGTAGTYWWSANPSLRQVASASSHREMIAHAMSTGRPMRGFEVDRSASTWSVAVPVRQHGRAVAVIEAVVDHHALLKEFIAYNRVDAAFFVEEPRKDRSSTLERMQQLGMDTSAVEEEAMQSSYVLDVSNDVKFFNGISSSLRLIPEAGAGRRWQEISSGNRVLMVRNQPLTNHADKTTAFVVWVPKANTDEGGLAAAGFDPARAAALGTSALLLLVLGAHLLRRKAQSGNLPARRSAQPPTVDEKYRALFRNSVEPLAFLEGDKIVDCNSSFMELLGYRVRTDLVGQTWLDISTATQPDGENSSTWLTSWQETLAAEGVCRLYWRFRCTDGAECHYDVTLSRIALDEGDVTLVTLEFEEEPEATGEVAEAPLQDLERILEERSEALLAAQAQIAQSDKLASVGRLASGVAHEINTPIQFVGDHFHALSDTFKDLQDLLTKYRGLVDLVEQREEWKEPAGLVRQAEKDLDLDYMIRDIPNAIAEGLDGVHQVASIVRAMKDFSHADHGEAIQVDLNKLVESIVTVARNEYKYVADVKLELGDLPLVECYAGQISQVILNLLVNAAHAIEDTGARGTITLKTEEVDGTVLITVTDTGAGIPEEIQDDIYDPFFSTKGSGRGTGQGLFIARQIVVEHHAGQIGFETEVGTGTTFHIQLPVRAPEEAEPAELEETEA